MGRQVYKLFFVKILFSLHLSHITQFSTAATWNYYRGTEREQRGQKSINELLETEIYFPDFTVNIKFFDDTDFVIKDPIKIRNLFSLPVLSDVVMHVRCINQDKINTHMRII